MHDKLFMLSFLGAAGPTKLYERVKSFCDGHTPLHFYGGITESIPKCCLDRMPSNAVLEKNDSTIEIVPTGSEPKQ